MSDEVERERIQQLERGRARIIRALTERGAAFVAERFDPSIDESVTIAKIVEGPEKFSAIAFTVLNTPGNLSKVEDALVAACGDKWKGLKKAGGKYGAKAIDSVLVMKAAKLGTEVEVVTEAAPARRVLLFTVDALAHYVSKVGLARFGKCAAWCISDTNDANATIFEQIAEPEVDDPLAETLLAAIESIVDANEIALEQVVGVCQRYEFGFHATASFEEARAAFEADGFVLSGQVVAGTVKVTPLR